MGFFRSVLSELHLWLGRKDFYSAHKHLVKSNLNATLMMFNSDGSAISIYTSDQGMASVLIGIASEYQKATEGE